jgi:hypothetical protein
MVDRNSDAESSVVVLALDLVLDKPTVDRNRSHGFHGGDRGQPARPRASWCLGGCSTKTKTRARAKTFGEGTRVLDFPWTWYWTNGRPTTGEDMGSTLCDNRSPATHRGAGGRGSRGAASPESLRVRPDLGRGRARGMLCLWLQRRLPRLLDSTSFLSRRSSITLSLSGVASWRNPSRCRCRTGTAGFWRNVSRPIARARAARARGTNFVMSCGPYCARQRDEDDRNSGGGGARYRRDRALVRKRARGTASLMASPSSTSLTGS